MSITTTEPAKDPRMKPAGEGADRPFHDLTRPDTPLAAELDGHARERFLRHACDLWTLHYASLITWRNKMKKWERMSAGDYSDRIGQPDPNSSDHVPDVFTYLNDTLGMSEGFKDFAKAQAKDDVFGTKPWLAATPEGRNDPNLAALISKHSQWKLDQSDLEPAIKDAINIACWGGTVFVKSRWHQEFETYKKLSKPAAHSKSTGGIYTAPGSGDLIHTAEELAEMKVNGADVEWKPVATDETVTVWDNLRAACIDYNDIAFDPKAPDLDLYFTPVFCRFRMGILDVIEHYKIPPELHRQLEHALTGADEEARAERGESGTEPLSEDPFESNQSISLVEGFIRCDPLKTGKPIRIHCVFSPTLQILFKLDYLANETPGGLLPIHPVRIEKIPRRIFGIGYFERFEDANNAIDRQYCTVTYRNQLEANIVVGVHMDALEKRDENSLVLSSRHPKELAADKSLKDFIEFATFPENNNTSVELLNQQLQMAQMRSGITSAAQGELKGVPNASTATGVNQLTSRGALLLKDPITQMMDDIREIAEFAVHMVYANQNTDETFQWGEGEASELLTIKAGDVRGLRMNVTLKLVQSQNQQKLANAQAAIAILANYSALPEIDKVAARPLYVQALESLGFNNAEDIIRQAVIDPAGILAIVPPEVAPVVQQALVSAGLMIAPDPSQDPSADDSAPVSDSPAG